MKETDFFKELGRRLKEFRKAAHYTQQEMAEMIAHYSDDEQCTAAYQTYQKYESGTNKIPLDKLFVICEILRISPNELLDYEEMAFVNAICRSYDIKYQTIQNEKVTVTLQTANARFTIPKSVFCRLIHETNDQICSSDRTSSVYETEYFQGLLKTNALNYYMRENRQYRDLLRLSAEMQGFGYLYPVRNSSHSDFKDRRHFDIDEYLALCNKLENEFIHEITSTSPAVELSPSESAALIAYTDNLIKSQKTDKTLKENMIKELKKRSSNKDGEK